MAALYMDSSSRANNFFDQSSDTKVNLAFRVTVVSSETEEQRRANCLLLVQKNPGRVLRSAWIASIYKLLVYSLMVSEIAALHASPSFSSLASKQASILPSPTTTSLHRVSISVLHSCAT